MVKFKDTCFQLPTNNTTILHELNYYIVILNELMPRGPPYEHTRVPSGIARGG